MLKSVNLGKYSAICSYTKLILQCLQSLWLRRTCQASTRLHLLHLLCALQLAVFQNLRNVIGPPHLVGVSGCRCVATAGLTPISTVLNSTYFTHLGTVLFVSLSAYEMENVDLAAVGKNLLKSETGEVSDCLAELLGRVCSFGWC